MGHKRVIKEAHHKKPSQGEPAGVIYKPVINRNQQKSRHEGETPNLQRTPNHYNKKKAKKREKFERGGYEFHSSSRAVLISL